MSIANTCVLIAAILPVVTMGLAKAATAGKRRPDCAPATPGCRAAAAP